MVVSRVGSALMKFLGLMGWISENSLGRGVRRFLDVLVSRWATTPILVFGTMCGVGNGPLRQCFQSCIAFLALGMIMRLIIFSSLMALLSKTLILLEQRMIGNRNSFPRFSC